MTDICVVDVVEQPTAGVRASVPMSELTEFFGRAFQETMTVLESQGVTPVGPPFGRYYGAPGAVIDVEAGFPVATAVVAADTVVPGCLPEGKAVEAIHVGAYDTLESTYAEMESSGADRGISLGATMWETYLSNPEDEPEPATWRTRITWPIA
ncbi:GyrI-like domain-containing protein [Nocardioides psychrotolerans]|uniref:GyrI-like domain-containing protein n=1 Tax=Nocardioides psychrotolerans TaxID=1005945 RepID=UPI0031381CD1